MVGAEDQRLMGIDAPEPFYPNADAAGLQNQPRPEPRAAVLPAPPGIKERAAQGGRAAESRIQVDQIIGEQDGARVAQVVAQAIFASRLLCCDCGHCLHETGQTTSQFSVVSYQFSVKSESQMAR